MVSLKFLATAVATLAALSTASPTPEQPALEKRTSSSFPMTIYQGRSCTNPAGGTVNVNPGHCHNVGAVGQAAKVNNHPNQYCVVKYWSGQDCSGEANTWYVPAGTNSGCFAIADNGGSTTIPGGIKSWIANCATDVVR